MSPNVDLAGIGIGPFNLSLAALLEPVAELRAVFFERRRRFAWHPDQLLPGARLQTSFLKDLVTPVDPTSRHSFLNYIVTKRRFYEFMNADQDAVLRAEFADYLAWVAGRLEKLVFGGRIDEVGLDGDRLRATGPGVSVSAAAVVVGTGKQPHVPSWAAAAVPGSCVHSSEALRRMPDLEGRRVAVVGGGQSGAELFLAIARSTFGRAREVAWISRRPTFAALDETHFVNEWFTPAFVRRFHILPETARRALRLGQKLAGDGISVATIREIYQHLYEWRHVTGDGESLTLLPAREVVACRRHGLANILRMASRLDGGEEQVETDIIVLATSFSWSLPACLGGLAARFERDNEGLPRLGLDYRIVWDGPPNARIYLQNGAEHTHGIADPQLSLMAWRAASIVNDVAGRRVYDLTEPDPIVRWSAISPEGRRPYPGVPDLSEVRKAS